jgi:conjugative relaxase-like TrwC/TraI family protein
MVKGVKGAVAMISISKPQGASQAKDYLSKESYYQQNSELGQWHGSALALKFLDLSDSASIEKKTYAAVLNGLHPKTRKHLLSNSGSDKRRAGIDITFSAPKSVSLLMELCEGLGEQAFEKRIRTAHEEAVQYAMNKVSRYYAKTRIRHGKGKRETANTHAVWASFQHDTTRETETGEIDPQLHTHNFLMALTFYEDPITGKLKPYAMSNEEIYTNKMYLGQVYRNALANNLGRLGLEIEVTDIEQGFFELNGFTQEQLEVFSGRRTELMEKLDASNLKSDNKAKMLDMINAKTKKNKRKIDRETLIAHNQNRMKKAGMNRSFVESIIAAKNFHLQLPRLGKEDKENLTLDHLQKSLDLLEEHHSLFAYEEIMKNALKLGLQYEFTLSDYYNAFEELMEQGRLIRLDENVYSTKAIVEAEKDVIRLIIEGKEAQSPYALSKDTIHTFIDQKYGNMTKGQRDMVSCVLGTQDQFVVAQGDAGTGKTYAASAIRDFMLLQNPTTEVIGLSFTGKAAQSLEEESGITSSTLHSFIYKEENRQDDIPKRRLILVDEAGMAGSLQIAKLMKIAKRNMDKVVFIGDTKQFSSIAAGNIFLDMQRFGAKTVYMSETMRQKSDHAKGIVKAIKNRQEDKAVDILEKKGSFNEMDRKESIEKIAQKYSEIYTSIDPLNDELIIASRNADCVRINKSIRQNLGKTGQGEEHTVKELWSQNGVGRYFTKDLEEGMIVIPSKVPMTKNGSEYRIKAIIDEKHIEVEASGGKSVVIDFYRYGQQCQIYKEVKKEFTLGDTIIFTKNANITQDTKVKNGERAVIKSIKNGIIETTFGKRVDLQKMNFIDYGYAITDYKSQGATTKNVTICADAQMASLNAFYTQVTRAKENITIYTENKEALLANLKKDARQNSTLKYTMQGRKIAQKEQIKEEISNGIREGGKALAEIELEGEKVAALLHLPRKLSGKEGNTSLDTLFQGIDRVIQKFDLLLDKLKKSMDQKKVQDPIIESVLEDNKIVHESQSQTIKIKF